MSRRLSHALLATAVTACTADAQSGNTQAHIGRIEHRLTPGILIRGEPVPAFTLADRLAHHRVPAVSIAVINGREIEWARAYGLADIEGQRVATTTTLFQAASISKPVAATAALTLVEDGRLDLDTDVNQYLTRWKVPENEHTRDEHVTLRRLVTHTAGITVHGFPGYARNEEIPSTVGVLDGFGNTDPIRVDTTPGAINRYSGGGYTVMQLMLSDVAGLPFELLLKERVLDPIGMTLSTYDQPLPESRWHEAATAYRSDGEPVEGKWHVYPEQAAAGLWTTPTELAMWGLAILESYDGADGGVLSPGMARQMLDPGPLGHGLGPAVNTSRGHFGHGGSNEGFRCQLVVFFDGRGAAVMTNSDNGSSLMREILATLADEYDWPAYRAEERTVADIDETILDEIAGQYEATYDSWEISIELARTEAGLRISSPQLPQHELLPQARELFFTRETGERAFFEWRDGKVVALRMFGFRAEKVR